MTKIKPLYNGRLEEKIRLLEQHTQNILNNNERNYADAVKELTEDRKSTIEKTKQELEKYGVPADDIDSCVGDFEKLFLAMVVSKEKLYKQIISVQTDIYDIVMKNILKSYSFSLDRDSYNPEIRIVDVILEGLTLKEMRKSRLSYEVTYKKSWENMQRAYFSGNVSYLRNVEEVFGRGTLREINNLLLVDNDVKERYLIKLSEKSTN